MTEIALFENGEFRLEITPDSADGFRVQGPSLAKALGFHSVSDMLRSLPDVEKGSGIVQTPGGPQRVGYVTEAGFYRVVGQRQVSRIGNAETRSVAARSQTWVFGEVLPALRRGESVQAAARPTSTLDVLAGMVAELQRIEREARAALAEAQETRAEVRAIAATHDQTLATVVEISARQDSIEGKHDWWAGLGYARKQCWPTDRKFLQRLGTRAGRIGRAAGLTVSKVQHGLYGEVNQWPAWCWDQAYEEIATADAADGAS